MEYVSSLRNESCSSIMSARENRSAPAPSSSANPTVKTPSLYAVATVTRRTYTPASVGALDRSVLTNPRAHQSGYAGHQRSLTVRDVGRQGLIHEETGSPS